MQEMRSSMKFIHTADLHIGAVPEEEAPWQKKGTGNKGFAKKIIDLCIEQKADMLLISGDLFHKARLSLNLWI